MRRAILAVALLCLSVATFAQVTIPSPVVPQQFFDNTGAPCAGCFLYTYSAGTSTPLATYIDSTGTTQNTDPIVLDSAGRASIWLGAFSYKFVLQDPNSVTLWTQDNINIFLLLSRNNTWSGTQTFNNSVTFSSNVSMTTIGAKVMGSIRFADQFSGADCGAKIMAADADLGVAAGEIWVNQNCGTAWTSAVTLSANHTIRFVQGGTYTTVLPVTLSGANSAIIGTAPAGSSGGTINNSQTRLQAATGALLTSEVVLMSGANTVIKNMIIDGNVGGSGTSTGGVAVKVSDANRVEILDSALQNAFSHGLSVTSTGTTNNSCCGRLLNANVSDNGGSGISCTASNDWFLGTVEIENNTADGITGSNCATWRVNHSDLGGNHGNGVTIGGAGGAPWGCCNLWIITANEFGNNYQNDLYINSAGSFYSANHTIVGNSFTGSNNRTDNTYDAILMESSSDNQITGNYFGGGTLHTYKYEIEEKNTNATAGPNVIGGNNFNSGGAGTAVYSLLSSIDTVVAGNREGSGTYGMLRRFYVPNNQAAKWADAAGTLTSSIMLDSANNFYLYGHPTQKTIIFQPNPGSTAATWTDTGLSTPKQLTSTLATGTSPLAVTSTTVNTNFNADMLDGFHAGNASTGKAMCWKDATHMGYCSTQPDATGACTCN